MGFWSWLTGADARHAQPGKGTQPHPGGETQAAGAALERIREAQRAVEQTERAVRDLEQSFSTMAGLSKPDPVKLKLQEQHHQATLAPLLNRHRWAEALQVLEERTDERCHMHARPVEADEDLKEVLRARLLSSQLEGGQLAGASAFLKERAELANRRIDWIRTDVRTRNRLVKGQLDTMNHSRGKS